MLNYLKNNLNKANNLYFTIFFLLNLSPFILSGFFFDDIFNSTHFHELSQTNNELFNKIKKWSYGGRIFVTSTITDNYFYYFLKGEIIYFAFYKIVIFILFYKTIIFFLDSYNLNSSSKTFIVLIFLLTLQFNPRWDPVTSFHPLIFLTAISIILSLVFFKISNKKKILYSSISLFFSLYAYLSYEISLLIFPSILIIFYLKNKKPKILFSLHFLLFISFLFISYYLRKKYGVNYDGNDFGNLKFFISSLIVNLFNSLPFSGYFNKVLPNGVNLLFFILSFPLFYFFYYLIINKEKIQYSPLLSSNKKLELYLIASVFVFIPAFLAAISQRYQIINTLGDPYIIIFYSRIGISVIIFLIILKFFKNFKYNKILFLLLLINFNINLYKIHLKNLDFKYPREITKKFVKHNKLSFNNKTKLYLDPIYLEEKKVECILGLYIDIKNFQCYHINHSTLDDLILKRNYDKKKMIIELTDKDGQYISRECSIYFHFYRCNEFKKGKNINKRIFGPSYHGGFYGWEFFQNEKFIWSSGEESVLKFYNFTKTNVKTKLSFLIDTNKNNEISLTFNNRIKQIAKGKKNIELNLNFKPGANELKFNFSGKPNIVLSDTRKYFAYNIKQIIISQ